MRDRGGVHHETAITAGGGALGAHRPPPAGTGDTRSPGVAESDGSVLANNPVCERRQRGREDPGRGASGVRP